MNSRASCLTANATEPSSACGVFAQALHQHQLALTLALYKFFDSPGSSIHHLNTCFFHFHRFFAQYLARSVLNCQHHRVWYAGRPNQTKYAPLAWASPARQMWEPPTSTTSSVRTKKPSRATAPACNDAIGATERHKGRRIWPPKASISACAPPLWPICTMLKSCSCEKYSAIRWPWLPVPGEPPAHAHGLLLRKFFEVP